MSQSNTISNDVLIKIVSNILASHPSSLGIREMAKIASNQADIPISQDRIKNSIKKIRKKEKLILSSRKIELFIYCILFTDLVL